VNVNVNQFMNHELEPPPCCASCLTD